ncbi:MAG: hypothetical protein OES32_10695 [Acidobacteriota bacterium]|nr:hypothetical protein [Acidobacteriota bacterium]
MTPRARVTVTLPPAVVREIDLRDRNRSRFILEAVEHEIESRRRQELLVSIVEPHPRSEEIAEAGLGEWGALASPGDEDLLDPAAGTAVRWRPGEGWVQVEE